MVDYSKEKFKVGEYIEFDIIGSELRGTGEILGMSSLGLAPMWIVLIRERHTEEMMQLVEKALSVQECFIHKIR